MTPKGFQIEFLLRCLVQFMPLKGEEKAAVVIWSHTRYLIYFKHAAPCCVLAAIISL